MVIILKKTKKNPVPQLMTDGLVVVLVTLITDKHVHGTIIGYTGGNPLLEDRDFGCSGYWEKHRFIEFTDEITLKNK